jgi:hypothetical protein
VIGSTLWILGTSVSIEDDGYATRLAASVQQRERQVRDLSVGAPAYAYARGTWADYGQSISDVPGNVAVFGMLYEPTNTAPPRGKRLGGFWQRLAAGTQVGLSAGGLPKPTSAGNGAINVSA